MVRGLVMFGLIFDFKIKKNHFKKFIMSITTELVDDSRLSENISQKLTIKGMHKGLKFFGPIIKYPPPPQKLFIKLLDLYPPLPPIHPLNLYPPFIMNTSSFSSSENNILLFFQFFFMICQELKIEIYC